MLAARKKRSCILSRMPRLFLSPADVLPILEIPKMVVLLTGRFIPEKLPASGMLALQMPGLIDQSGLELGFGLTPLSLFCIVEFSNKEGITVEMYPMEYLVDYQCRSPFYKDKNELLVRPKPGTREYDYGFDSPLIKQWEDEVDSKHVEV